MVPTSLTPGANATALIAFAAGTYVGGDSDPEILEPIRRSKIDRPFWTLPGELTNADVNEVAARMGPQKKFGIFGLDRTHGPVLLATSPDEDIDHFKFADPKLYRPEIGITDLSKQTKRLRVMRKTPPVQIIPDENRYEVGFEKAELENAAHFAKDEMAATMLTYWQAHAVALFLAGAKGLNGTSDLMSSAQVDAMWQGLKHVTRSGELLDKNGVPLRAFGLPQIVPVDDPRYPKLSNGTCPGTVSIWTRTDWSNKDGGFFPVGIEAFLPVARGAAWAHKDARTLRAANRIPLSPNFSRHYLGLRVAFEIRP